MEYACPVCKRKLFIVETTQGSSGYPGTIPSGFKYKASCHGCSYYDYYVTLNALKEYKGKKE